MPEIEYRLERETKSHKRSVSLGQKSMRLPERNEIYELREVGSDCWTKRKTNDNGEITLYVVSEGVQFMSD